MNHVEHCFAICLSMLLNLLKLQLSTVYFTALIEAALSFLTIGNLLRNVDTRCASKDSD